MSGPASHLVGSLPLAATRDIVNRAVREVGRLGNYITCNGCGRVLDNPQRVTTCGHTVCGACAAIAGNQCPILDCPIPTRAKDIEPDHQAAAIVSAVLKVTNLAFKDNPVSPLKGFPDTSAGPVQTVVAVETFDEREIDPGIDAASRGDKPSSGVHQDGCRGETDAFFDEDLPLLSDAPTVEPSSPVADEGLGDPGSPVVFSRTVGDPDGEPVPVKETAETDAETQPPPGANVGSRGLAPLDRVVASPCPGPILSSELAKRCQEPSTLVVAGKDNVVDASSTEPLSAEDGVAEYIRERQSLVGASKPLSRNVFLTNLSPADRPACESTCRAFGWELVGGFDGDSHPSVVVTKLNARGEVLVHSYATLMAILFEVPIVSEEWLAVSERTQFAEPLEAYRARVSYQNSSSPLFSRVLAVNELDAETEEAREVTSLLVAGGAQVVDAARFSQECLKETWKTCVRVVSNSAATATGSDVGTGRGIGSSVLVIEPGAVYSSIQRGEFLPRNPQAD